MPTLDDALLQVLVSLIAAQHGLSEDEACRQLGAPFEARPAGCKKNAASTVTTWGMQ